ncbi:MAG: DJ-1/PfpI family protein [Pyrinomonadaceae bacterium]
MPTQPTQTFNIGMPLYEGFDSLDVIGPYEAFFWMGNYWAGHTVNRYLVGPACADDPTKAQTLTASNGLQIVPQKTFADPELQLDLVFVPGGLPEGFIATMTDQTYINFLRRHCANATYVTSVCFGAFLLASAGLLDGCQATTYWSGVKYLKLFPKIKVADFFPRYVVNDATGADARRVVTGGGISSAIDEALALVALITGDDRIAQQVQLTLQYNPRPPFSGGDPTVADPSLWQPAAQGFDKAFGDSLTKAIKQVLGTSSGGSRAGATKPKPTPRAPRTRARR